LQDTEMSNAMPEFFGDPPEIVGGVLVCEAEKVWRSSNPLVWAFIRYRGCFGGDPVADACVHPQGTARTRRFNWRQIAHMMISKAPRKRVSPIDVPAFKGQPNPKAQQAPVPNLGTSSRVD